MEVAVDWLTACFQPRARVTARLSAAIVCRQGQVEYLSSDFTVETNRGQFKLNSVYELKQVKTTKNDVLIRKL